MAERKTHKRSDVARGFIRGVGLFIEDSPYSAPPFCIACELVDKTALPHILQKTIWAIVNAISCIEKGEEGAYIRGIPGLKCIIRKNEKSSIIRELHGEEPTVLREVGVEIRIHEAKCIKPNGEVLVEHYIFLIASSPLAFSIRKAIYTTLQLKSRGQDAVYSDMRRSTWNMLATHVRQGLSLDAQDMRYTDGEVCDAHNTSGIDWIMISGSLSFTRLFSVVTSVDWVRNHFFSKHADVDVMTLEGFGDLSRNFECTDPAFISGCMKYDEDVDKAIALSRSKTKKRRRDGDNNNNSNNNNNDDDDEEDREVSILTPIGFMGGDGRRGYPKCEIAMKVMVPIILETSVSLFQFLPQVHAFPASVILDILKKALGIASSPAGGGPVMLPDAGGGEDEEEEQYITLSESQNIVCGRQNTLNRPMLSNGDASWAVKCEKSVMSLGGSDNRELLKVSHLRSFIRLGFGLALTRAMGSDTYVNSRVSAYGNFIEHSNGSLSIQECVSTYEKIDKSCRPGCGMHEALMLLERTLSTCNGASWNLRPDNLFLVLQMTVSDVMLCLNYHGSVIGGACNGIGATLVVRDGGGNYRRWFKDPSSSETGSSLGQVYSKKNGSGADLGVSVYKSVSGIGVYYSRFNIEKEIISELKRTTELGLMQDTCNIVEGVGSDVTQVHSVTETMGRKYSTELKAGNDSQSQSCMQAIAWLVPRNTTSTDVNIFKTTRENEKTKSRVSVEYRQVINGYWLVCSNAVGNLSRERFRTLTTVCRNIMSAGNALDPSRNKKQPNNNNGGGGGDDNDHDDEDGDSRRKNAEAGVQDPASTSKDSYDPRVITEAKPIFFSSLCTAIVTGFMQWTGILGKLPSSPCLEAILGVFYAQMDLSKSILNPDMMNQGERPRCLQISKARGVASSLIAVSIQETIDAGRLKKGHQDAIEGCSLRLMIESTSAAVAPWIIADTMEHMLRLDFFILMQIFCQKLNVPENIGLENLLSWLRTGDPSAACPALKEWLEVHPSLPISRLDKRTGLTSVDSCMYISHPSLSCNISDPSPNVVDATVCDYLGMILFKQFSEKLAQECQIHENLSGAEVIKAMLTYCTNQQFAWPSVFGNIKNIPNFWMNNVPANREIANNLTLCPIRIVIVEAHRAAIWIDARWLLLTSALCGVSPSQTSRFLVVGQWIQYFYRQCIPDRMITSKELFIGIPSPVMHGGFVCPPIISSGKRLLMRPTISTSNAAPACIGTDAPIASGMVEDLGPAAPRYQLAKILKMDERRLPVDCVRYSLPHGMWTPVRIESDGTFGSIKTSNDGLFWLARPGHDEDITFGCDDDDGPSYLDGRVSVNVRPLCIFDRPGVLLSLDNNDDNDGGHDMGVILQYQKKGTYKILKDDGSEVELDPYKTEDAVLKMGSTIYMRVSAFADEWKQKAIFYINPKNRQSGEMQGRATNASTNVIECTLSIPIDEATPEGHVRVCYQMHKDVGQTSVAFFGSSKIGSNVSAYTVCQYLDVHVSHIIGAPTSGLVVFRSVFYQDN